MRLFIFGAGYSARTFARRVAAEAEWIGGTTRTAEKGEALRQAGIEPVLFDGTAPSAAVAAALATATHVLVSIGPSAAGDPVLTHHRAELAAAQPAWIGYLSTVGVYGDHGGAWVDERTPCRPVSRRSIQRLAAEGAWLGFSAETGLPVQVFRLSGIYGPGRNALENLKKGTARRIVKPAQVFNRIHVDDIAGVLHAALNEPKTTIYNVTDDEPAPPQDVVAYAADLLKVPPPPEVAFEAAEMTPMARSFYGENKRVSNAKMKNELNYTLLYPTYREALASLASDFKKR